MVLHNYEYSLVLTSAEVKGSTQTSASHTSSLTVTGTANWRSCWKAHGASRPPKARPGAQYAYEMPKSTEPQSLAARCSGSVTDGARGRAGYAQNPRAGKAQSHHRVPELQMLLPCPSPALGRGKRHGGPEYLLWSYRNPLLAPVLHKGPGSVLPAQMNAENIVSPRAKPSLDVSRQSSAEPVGLTSPKDLPRVCPQVDNLISLLSRDRTHHLNYPEVLLPKSVFVLQHSHVSQTSAAL